MNREWNYDYDDVRNRLSTLEGVVSELNKVGRGVEMQFFLPLRLRTPSEVYTDPKETSTYSPSDASTG